MSDLTRTDQKHNGELMVKDVASCQKLLDLAEQVRVLDGIRRGLEDMRAGRGRPAAEVFDDIRRDLDLPKKP